MMKTSLALAFAATAVLLTETKSTFAREITDWKCGDAHVTLSTNKGAERIEIQTEWPTQDGKVSWVRYRWALGPANNGRGELMYAGITCEYLAEPFEDAEQATLLPRPRPKDASK
jgi:hypothetical protein